MRAVLILLALIIIIGMSVDSWINYESRQDKGNPNVTGPITEDKIESHIDEAVNKGWDAAHDRGANARPL